MSKVNELRNQRAKAWEQAKAFLDSHRNEKGILSAEDTAAYERMEQEIVDLGHEIERQERADALERELAAPVSTPITAKPEAHKIDGKVGRASDAYHRVSDSMEWWCLQYPEGGSFESEEACLEVSV